MTDRLQLDITPAQLRRIVDGAVRDALATHPEYLTPLGKRKALNGVAKRVTGAIKGFAVQQELQSSATKVAEGPR